MRDANSEYANEVKTHAIPHPKKLMEIAGPAILAPNPTKTNIPAPTDDPTPYNTKSSAVNVRRKLPLVDVPPKCHHHCCLSLLPTSFDGSSPEVLIYQTNFRTL